MIKAEFPVQVYLVLIAIFVNIIPENKSCCFN